MGMLKQHIYFPQFWGLEVQDQGAGWITPEASLPSLQMAIFRLCLHLAFPLYALRGRALLCLPLSVLWD